MKKKTVNKRTEDGLPISVVYDADRLSEDEAVLAAIESIEDIGEFSQPLSPDYYSTSGGYYAEAPDHSVGEEAFFVFPGENHNVAAELTLIDDRGLEARLRAMGFFVDGALQEIQRAGEAPRDTIARWLDRVLERSAPREVIKISVYFLGRQTAGAPSPVAESKSAA